MTNKKVALIGLGIFGILIILVILFWPKLPSIVDYWRIAPTPTQGQNPKTVTDDIGLYHFVATYKGNSTWEYMVTAKLPNPCYTTKVDARVAESYPEQVTITVTSGKSDGFCIQTTKDYSFEDSFTASENAVIRFSVKNSNL